VRDARIITLYEGTTGIQAADLLGRKILKLQGVGFRHFLGEIEAFCQRHRGHPPLAPFVDALGDMAKQWTELTTKLAARAAADPEEIGAAAVDYLFYSGYATLGYLWARSVAAAETGGQAAEFKQAKRDTALFYFARILPRCLAHRAAIESGAASLPEIA